MSEQKIIKEFACPHCGETETCTRVAVEPLIQSGKVPEDAPIAAEKIPIPLISPERSSGLTIPFIFYEFDYCFGCGTKYLVRVSTFDAPIKLGPAPGMGGQGMNPFGQNFGGPPMPFGRG